ncbi:MAG: ABC transporter substrate-binding protein [Betaproteobacteria bacterium]|nr:ABC transporter substrate-binding protein [Betaproteobacteria bacterium]
MNTRKLFISAAQSACWLLAAASSAMAAGAAPDALVKSTVADVVAVIKQNKDKQVLRQLTEQKVLPHFDFKRMTQLAVGKAWREANQTQQQALESGFRTLLVNTYTNVLKRSAAADRVAIDVAPVRPQSGQDEVTVKTVVKQSGKQPLAIDYRMQSTADGWKVYDVVVENISLVVNYRASFEAEISHSGVDGLIKVLDEKNRALAKS